jgi:single-stranded-DNA-specific exonuclease
LVRPPPTPRFAMAGLRLRDVMAMGTGHLRLRLAGDAGPDLEAVAFGARDSDLGPALEAARGRMVHVAGRIEANSWQGRTRVQLRLDDAAPA